MFKTGFGNTNNPERTTRTPCPTRSKRIKLHQQQASLRKQQWGNYSTIRPYTSPLMQTNKYDTLNSTGRQSHLLNARSIDVVENQLESNYKDEMCGYLKKKLRNLVSKRQEDIAFNRYLQNTIDNNEIGNTGYSTIGPLDQLYSTFNQKKSQKIEKGIEEAYMNNAKEQIVRMIHRKREQQDDFTQLNKSIKVRRVEKEEKRARSLRDQWRVPLVEEQKWDRQWQVSTNREKKRYHNRLWAKCNRELNSNLLANFIK